MDYCGKYHSFLVSQLIDVTIFHFVKTERVKNDLVEKYGLNRYFITFDSFIVLGIAFWLPGKIDTKMFIASALTGYTVKLLIAVGLTPLIYLGHYLIEKYLARDAK